jgi:hypothetical protein
MLGILRDAAIIGLGVTASAAALQGMYKVTNFYPPAPIFWFFSGFGGYLAIEAAEHFYFKKELIQETQHPAAIPTTPEKIEA